MTASDVLPNYYYTLVPKILKAPDESDLLGKAYYRVTAGFTFVMIEDSKNTQSVTVHRGFLTGGYSLPSLARKLLDKWLGLSHPAVTLHDWLSEYLLIESNYVCLQINKRDALAIFLKALEHAGLSERRLKVIKNIMSVWLVFKNPWATTLSPYKRYIEDRSYCNCN